jgi:hypothetical protein
MIQPRWRCGKTCYAMMSNSKINSRTSTLSLSRDLCVVCAPTSSGLRLSARGLRNWRGQSRPRAMLLERRIDVRAARYQPVTSFRHLQSQRGVGGGRLCSNSQGVHHLISTRRGGYKWSHTHTRARQARQSRPAIL